MKASDPETTLQHAIGSLAGKPLWSVIFGRGTGSALHLSFGDKVPRHPVIDNPVLREDQRRYVGEVDILVRCVWRVQDSDVVLASSEGVLAASTAVLLGQLESNVVVRGLLSPPAWDLTLTFDSRRELRVFCDRTEADEGDNYVVYTRDGAIAVGPGGVLSTSL